MEILSITDFSLRREKRPAPSPAVKPDSQVPAGLFAEIICKQMIFGPGPDATGKFCADLPGSAQDLRKSPEPYRSPATWAMAGPFLPASPEWVTPGILAGITIRLL
jgi:hypothetical protein